MSRWKRVAAVALLAVAVATTSNLVPVAPAVAAPKDVTFPEPSKIKRVELGMPRKSRPVAARKPYARFDPSHQTTLPGAHQATVALASGSLAAAAGRDWTRAGAGPVSLSRALSGAAPQRVQVSTVDQKSARSAGVHGVMFSLRSADGSGGVAVRVDDSTFRNAYGGDYAARLRLVQLPSCAVTTPQLPQCRTRTPLPTQVGAPLTAQVSLAAPAAAPAALTPAAGAMVVLAAESDTSGSAGDYSATSLSPGGTWSVSDNTGSFSYNYPIAVPPPIGGVAPSVQLSYSSASQDARTVGTNNQSSWIGDGWSSGDSYIERTFKPCKDVKDSGAPEFSGDLCWAGQILTLSLNGTSTQLVYDDDAKTFRSVDDSSTSKVEMLSDAKNGTKNGEHFRVTENGVQYYFGLNNLPGWSADDEETKSAWTVPVYKAHDGVGECPDGDFADTACTLGYRFNLDYVVDLNANAMAYYYATETGHYGANMKDAVVSYIRGGTLKRIDYGMTASTVYAGTAPQQVVFTTEERCLAGAPAGNNCADDQFTASHPEYWPDVPVDLNCKAGDTDCTLHGPSFWSRKRLTSIGTRVQASGSAQYVDRYDFTHTFPDGGDHAPTLWLDSIQHTGLDRLGEATTDAPMPPVTFNPTQLPNRVGSVPGIPRMFHNRIRNIISETGSETTIEYHTPACSGLPASDLSDAKDSKAQAFASTNTTGCFPAYWTPEGQPRPMIDWFYTHPVSSVATLDRNNAYQDGTAPQLLTEYTYRGDPGWHYDDNEIVKAKNRTWGQFRGYPQVDVKTGDPGVFHLTNKAEVHDQKTLTSTFYFLGMAGDTLPDDKKRSVAPLTSLDRSISAADQDAYAGRAFETVTYTGDGGTVDNSTVTVPTTIGPTASRARTGLPALTAQMVRTAKTVTRQNISSGWRRSEDAVFYNTTLGQSTTGMPVQNVDRGEIGAVGNVARCTFTRYLDGKTATLTVPAQVIITDQDCAAPTTSLSGSLISDIRTSFDGNPFAYNGDGQANPARPAKGNPTAVQQASAASGATTTATVTMSTTAYDAYGRVTSTTRTPTSTAADGSTSLAQTVYTRYTPASGAPRTVTTVTQVTPGVNCAAATVSTKDCQLSSVIMSVARQMPLATTDIAGALTSLTYDALGRLSAVWLPNKNKAADAPASMLHTYTLSKTKPSVVTTKTLLDNQRAGAPPTYSVTKTLYDGMLRKLETQETGDNGSVVVSDIQYDSHGWTVLTNNSYAAAGEPSDTLVSDRLSQVSIPATTATDHDAMGRVTQITEEHNGAQTRRTRHAYTGDKTTIIPPTGGVASTQTSNGRGQLTQLQQYTTAPAVTGTITGGFTASGGTGDSITYTYTSAGNQASVTGPDQSVWRDTYDLLGRQISHADPDTGTSFTRYDAAGNVTATKDARGIELNFTYDLLGRKLAATDKSKSDFKYAAWTYDTLRIGKPTSSTRYVSGVTGGYTVAVDGYSTLGNSLGQTITLPSAERPLPVSYTTSFAYTPNNELLAQQDDPAVAGLIGETITYRHNTLGMPTTTSGAELYVSGTLYNDFGQPSRITMGASTNEAQVQYAYDDYTWRLTGRTVSRSRGIGPVVDETRYSYDDAGNPLSVTNLQSETGNTVTDSQCYRYNTLARLTQAWTAKDSCPPAGTIQPTTESVASGPGSYWQSFTYDSIGNRTQLVDHSTAGGSDTTTDYINGCSTGCNRTGAQPHTLTATTGGANPTGFVYDLAGNLLTRTPSAGTAQSHKWDDEGNLAEVSTSGADPTSTKYLYDADGNQLIRRDPGRTTLFTADTQVVIDTSVNPAVTLGAVRTYAHGGSGTTIAVRSSLPGGGIHYLVNDPHGTAGLSMDTTDQKVSRQQYKPYGESRTSANSTGWPDPTHGYLGAPEDTQTGYTDLGARKYDPTLGRFISADPILQNTDPNQLGGYTYAGSNPVTNADPSGLSVDTGNGSGNGDRINPDTGKVLDPGNDGSDGDVDVGGGDGGDDAGGGDPYVPITPHVLVAPDDPHYGKMLAGYNGLQRLYGTTFSAKMSRNQEMSIWYSICVGGGSSIGDPSNCPRGLTQQAWNYVRAQDYDDGLVYLVDKVAFPDASGIGAAYLPNGEGFCSFSAATLVLMADGGRKPISEIAVGDEVTATNPDTGDPESRPVRRLWDHRDTFLTLETDAGTITTTARHPFWDDRSGSWVPAGDLSAGAQLRGPNGERVAVTAVQADTGVGIAYNLTVAKLHTFYVLAGDTPVLVHNKCGTLKYVTYTKANPTTGQIYSGRSRGYGSPEQIVARRDVRHHMTAQGFTGPAQLDTSAEATKPLWRRWDDPAYQAMRGREQMMIDFNGRARSEGGTSGNAIRGIALSNPLITRYMQAATGRYGQIRGGGGGGR